jgi:endonuclease/exonuclease/phosphatase (EEP) superfamily protein YafD
LAGVRVLSWNLFHGRALPPAHRDLLADFTAALAGWEWDVALLQEVPPWWPEPLARAAAAHPYWVLTSRNSLPRVRRALAIRWPDLMKSSGGGANLILVRGAGAVRHLTHRLCRLPERRWLHAVELREAWVGNLHASTDWRAARSDCALAADVLRRWAGYVPCVLGGDLNLRHPELEGYLHCAARDVDHVFARGMKALGSAQVLERGALSDHPPLLVELGRRSSTAA